MSKFTIQQYSQPPGPTLNLWPHNWSFYLMLLCCREAGYTHYSVLSLTTNNQPQTVTLSFRHCIISSLVGGVAPPPPQGRALIFIPAGGGDASPPDPSPPPLSAQMHPKTWVLGTFFSHGEKIFGAFGACHTLCTYCSMCAPSPLLSRLPCPNPRC